MIQNVAAAHVTTGMGMARAVVDGTWKDTRTMQERSMLWGMRPRFSNMWTVQALSYLKPIKDANKQDDHKEFRPREITDFKKDITKDMRDRPRPRTWYSYVYDEEFDEQHMCVYANHE